jgi:hypothetical protein
MARNEFIVSISGYEMMGSICLNLLDPSFHVIENLGRLDPFHCQSGVEKWNVSLRHPKILIGPMFRT